MKKVRKVINKNIKMLLILAAFTAVALAVLLLLITGNKERDQIATDPTEPSKAAETSTQAEEETTARTEPGVSQEAQDLFNVKAGSIDDPAQVARLLETIDLKEKVASYTVELQLKKEPKSMTITFDKTVDSTARKSFDEEMQKYAEQILALVPDAGQVQWVYNVSDENKRKEEVTVYLDAAKATEILKTDVRKYGESAKTVQRLLEQQKGY